MNNNTLVYNLLRKNNEYVYLSDDLIDIREKYKIWGNWLKKEKTKALSYYYIYTFHKNQIS